MTDRMMRFVARAVLPLACSTAVIAAPLPALAQSVTNSAIAPASAAMATPQYKVNAGDELDIFVWGEERMQRSVRVQPDGTFAFPLAGTIAAKGRNVSDISADIRERISVNYRATVPDVTVTVRTASEMRFFVVGKVRAPGSFTSATTVNILQALSMAGGPVEFADVKNAVVLRQQPDGGQIVEPVRLHSVLKGRRAMSAGRSNTPLPTLSSGDVLVIP